MDGAHMPRVSKSDSELLAEVRAKKAAAVAKLEAKEARILSRLKDRSRMDDTRRKILSGAWLLYTIQDGDAALLEKFREQFPGFITGRRDKNQGNAERDLALFSDELRLSSPPLIPTAPPPAPEFAATENQ